MRSFAFEVGLIVMMVLSALCVSLPTVKARDVVPLDWTSPTTNNLYSVFMVSATDGWAVGYYGAIIHWDGSSWSNVTSPTTRALRSVFMVSASDGWAVGTGGTIIRWTGTVWIPEFSTAILMPLLMTLSLVVVVITKTVLKKRKTPFSFF